MSLRLNLKIIFSLYYLNKLLYISYVLKLGGESVRNSLALPGTVKSEYHPT